MDLTARLDTILEQLVVLSSRSYEPVPSVPDWGHPSGKPKQAEKVWNHLTANPEDHSLSVRDLADKLAVGKSTVSRVKQEMQR